MAQTPITLALLEAAHPGHTADHAPLVEPMNRHAAAYDITTPLRVAHFLSQIGHESGFRIVEENGVYGAQRMRQVFGCKGGSAKYDAATDDCKVGRLRDKLWTQEAFYAGNAKNLLAYAYASRLGNGDEPSGDGFKYRGRGMMQLTGKKNYAAFTVAHNKKHPDDARDFVADPDLLIGDVRYGIESAFFFWDARGLNALADKDDVTKVTLAVNGGLNGLAERQALLRNVKRALGI